MTSREIILANLNHDDPPRPGLTFSGGRANDMLGVGRDGGSYHPKRWVDGCQEFYDQPALAAKLREHKVALRSPTDIQKVLPTGDRDLIVAETARMLETFRGGFIGKNYPDLPGIGVDPEWDQWAYEVMADCKWAKE